MKMPKTNSLIFLGNERLATATPTTAPVLRALIAAGYKIEAVIAGHSEIVSRQKRQLEIGPVAQGHGIPVVLLGRDIDLADKLKKHPAKAAVLVAFGKQLPPDLIGLFPKGIINIHPSLLPQMRGATPIETAILDGLTETGVSIMKITDEMDAGPVYAQSKLGLSGSETKFELAEKLGNLGAHLLIKHLHAILDGSMRPVPQDESSATYTKRIDKADGAIDWSKSAGQIEREVRAYAGWPKSRTKLKDFDVILTKVRLAKNEGDGQLVQNTGNGWIEILELIAPSGKTISGEEFLRGYS